MNWISQDLNSGVVYHGGSGDFLNVKFPSFSQPFDYGQFQGTSNDDVWKNERKKDEDFIKNFVSNIEKKKVSQKVDGQIKIYEAKEKLLKIIALKSSLEREASIINVNDEDFDTKWISIEQQMTEINEMLRELVSNTEPLRKSLLKRLKKRNAKKKKNLKWLALKEEKRRQIQEKNIMIDKILNERKDEVEAIKREAALKRQADAVLHEVRRKKYEGSKMLNMLSALEKLRDLRIKEEEKNGGYCSKKLTEVFSQVINKFKNLWEKQIEEYKLEEKGLKIILEANALPHVKESELEMNLLQWEKALFGDVTDSQEEKMLTQADNDLEAFIQVRRDWDRFLASDSTAVSSSIPLGWVIPPETNDEHWKKFLIKNRSSEKEHS